MQLLHLRRGEPIHLHFERRGDQYIVKPAGKRKHIPSSFEADQLEQMYTQAAGYVIHILEEKTPV